MWMWIRNTFSDTLRFPSLGLVSVFKNTTENELDILPFLKEGDSYRSG
jgi:hypothetical protein